MPTPLGYALARGYCEIDPELVLPQVRSNIEKCCDLIAKGRVDFNKVVSHVLSIFNDKFRYFSLSIGIMEKLLTIIRISMCADSNRELLLSSKIHMNSADKAEAINFCIRCFNGHFTAQYHNKKGWGIKCTSCNFRVACLTGAGAVYRENEKCEECESHLITAQFKDNSPFPGGAKQRTGCLLCDSVMKGTITNSFFKQARIKTPAEIEEDAKRREE